LPISEINVSPDKMATLMKVSRTLDDMLNRAPDRHAPYVGSAFVTKTGIHASAVLKDPRPEHVPPEGRKSSPVWCPIRPADRT
jgi:2-isopropylmalate synthase